MEPALFEGDWLIFLNLRYPIGSLVGKIVLVARKADTGQLTIKRVVREEGSRYWVEGENKEHSTDSRQYGLIEPAEIIGVYLFRYKVGYKFGHKKG